MHIFVLCLTGAMTQPIVANASAVLCDPANPTANNSGNNVAAHITNTLESAEAPVLKFNHIVKTQDHAISELSKQSSDALEMFSEYLTNLAASSTHLDKVQSKTPTNAWEMSHDVGVCNFWPGLDLHDIIQGLVNVLAPLQTLMRVQEKRTATLEEMQRTAQMPVFARRVFVVETSLTSMNANKQTSWMSNLPARLKSPEDSIAANSATSVVTQLGNLEAALPLLGKPGVYRDPPESESSGTTSALLKALPERLRIESNLEMLGTVHRHWDRMEMHKLTSVESLPFKTTQEPCMVCSTIASATTAIDGWHRTFV